jgi:hypothetical protein
VIGDGLDAREAFSAEHPNVWKYAAGTWTPPDGDAFRVRWFLDPSVNGQIEAIAMSPDEEYVYLLRRGDWPSIIKIRADGTPMCQVPVVERAINPMHGLVVLPDGRLVVTETAEGPDFEEEIHCGRTGVHVFGPDLVKQGEFYLNASTQATPAARHDNILIFRTAVSVAAYTPEGLKLWEKEVEPAYVDPDCAYDVEFRLEPGEEKLPPLPTGVVLDAAGNAYTWTYSGEKFSYERAFVSYDPEGGLRWRSKLGEDHPGEYPGDRFGHFPSFTADGKAMSCGSHLIVFENDGSHQDFLESTAGGTFRSYACLSDGQGSVFWRGTCRTDDLQGNDVCVRQSNMEVMQLEALLGGPYYDREDGLGHLTQKGHLLPALIPPPEATLAGEQPAFEAQSGAAVGVLHPESGAGWVGLHLRGMEPLHRRLQVLGRKGLFVARSHYDKAGIVYAFEHLYGGLAEHGWPTGNADPQNSRRAPPPIALPR